MADVVVTIKFVVPEDDPRAEPFDFATVLKTGRALQVAPFPVTVHDLRPRVDTDNAPLLDVEGFATQKVPCDGLNGMEGWEDAYSRWTAEWLCEYLGARKVVYYNYHVRRRIAEDDPD
ncbi:hypothetical protein JCM10213v2_000793 [Rhodosporidiobolus nylandii]